MVRVCCLTLMLGVFATMPLRAQEQGQEPEPAVHPHAASLADDEVVKPPPFRPTMDIGDIWHRVRHTEPDPSASEDRRVLVATPTFSSKPSTGLTLGFNSSVAFFSGDSKTTHISTLSGGGRVSQQGQVTSGMRFAIFTDDDRWFLQGDNRLQFTSLNTYALGINSPVTSATNAKYNFVRVSETIYRNVAPGLFVGGGLVINSHSNVRAGGSTSDAQWQNSGYLTYSREHGFATDGQGASGTTIAVLFDSRDNAINAQRGWLANASYRTYFNGFLGGDSTWQELVLDARHYIRLTADGRRRLALWAQGDFVTGGTAPYFDLPAIGGDGRSARGYTEGRYRGDHLVYGEAEFRSDVTRSGLLGMVAFVNTTSISDTLANQSLFDSWAPGAGLGLRVLLNKRSRTNLAVDYGWGKAGSTGFYLGIQEAF